MSIQMNPRVDNNSVRGQIEQGLTIHVERAMARFNEAVARLRTAVAKLPHKARQTPDESLVIEVATREKIEASEALARALKQRTEHPLDERVPNEVFTDGG